jgi:hypothetical protein
MSTISDNSREVQQLVELPLSNRRGWQFHAERINAAWGKQVESIIETGRYLVEAHDEMERASFEAMVQQKLAFGPSAARKLIVIARHPTLTNCAHMHKLPPSWGTLYDLTKLPTPMLCEKLQDGSINPKLERKTVATWRNAERNANGERDAVTVDGKAIERKPSLAEKLKAAETEIEKLKVKLKRAGGSLFDLHADKIEDIAAAIAANMPERRAVDLAKAIPKRSSSASASGSDRQGEMISANRQRSRP